MFKRNLLSVLIGSVLFLGFLLLGQDCVAQGDPCNPDPCLGILNAVPDTCTAFGGACAPATDFTCDCDSGYAWEGATHTCQEDPAIWDSAVWDDDNWNP